MTQQRGIELAALFYAEVVRPILMDIPHSAALLGEGSEVLGFDSVRSHDHAWGSSCDGRSLPSLTSTAKTVSWRGWRRASAASLGAHASTDGVAVS